MYLHESFSNRFLIHDFLIMDLFMYFAFHVAAQLQNLLQSGEISQQQLMELLTSGALGGGPGGGMGALESLL